MGALHDYSFLTCKSDMVVCQELLQPGPFLLGSFHAAVFPLAVVFGSAATVQVSSFSTGLATTHQPLMCPRWRAMFISSRFTRVCHCNGGFGDFVPQIFTTRLFVQDLKQILQTGVQGSNLWYCRLDLPLLWVWDCGESIWLQRHQRLFLSPGWSWLGRASTPEAWMTGSAVRGSLISKPGDQLSPEDVKITAAWSRSPLTSTEGGLMWRSVNGQTAKRSLDGQYLTMFDVFTIRVVFIQAQHSFSRVFNIWCDLRGFEPCWHQGPCIASLLPCSACSGPGNFCGVHVTGKAKHGNSPPLEDALDAGQIGHPCCPLGCDGHESDPRTKSDFAHTQPTYNPHPRWKTVAHKIENT